MVEIKAVYWQEVAKELYPDENIEKEADLYHKVAKQAVRSSVKVSIAGIGDHSLNGALSMIAFASKHLDETLNATAYKAGYEAHLADGYSGNHEELEGLLSILKDGQESQLQHSFNN